MKNQTSLWLLGLLVATLLLLPHAANAQCFFPAGGPNDPSNTPASTNANLIGNYQANVAGIFAPNFIFPPYPYGQGVISIALTADGLGHLTTQQTLYAFPLFPSALVPSPVGPFGNPQTPIYIGGVENGSYTINCDGTGRFFVHDGSIGFFEYEVVLVKIGTGIAQGFYLMDSNNTLGQLASGAGVHL